MEEMNTKYGIIKIYAETFEEEARGQVIKLANSLLGKDAHIRIMPDAHAGKGCVIGTTMKIIDKVCPSIVGVDIGCGVTLAYTNLDLRGKLEKLDKIIHQYVPAGFDIQPDSKLEYEELEELYCWKELEQSTRSRAICSSGTLGGGNHYIEAYDNGAICVHTGSRNIGLAVAKYYQAVATKEQNQRMRQIFSEELSKIEPTKREEWIHFYKSTYSVPDELAYLSGDSLEKYLHDAAICQRFADYNRHCILKAIVKNMGGKVTSEVNSIHNYIDMETRILRKGAIRADEGQTILIPLNMRDGLLVCEGKGNEDWNNSAPHGAGRLMSRGEARKNLTVHDFKQCMQGIYTTTANESTIDEAPMAYKDAEEIKKAIEPTAKILVQYHPIYNFKAGEE